MELAVADPNRTYLQRKLLTSSQTFVFFLFYFHEIGDYLNVYEGKWFGAPRASRFTDQPVKAIDTPITNSKTNRCFLQSDFA